MKSPFVKYFLLQIPGWIVAALLLWSVQQWLASSPWLMSVGLSAWILKDLALYPLVRAAYESDVKTGIERLIGDRGVVQNELAPRGKVRVRGELWSAEIESGSQPLAQGEPVLILGAQGITLIVAAESTDTRENRSFKTYE